MTYNLLRERWIPIRRASGARDWIAPHQIAERTDPPVALASPRPDFDGALIQFLIGLVQTTAAPTGKIAWEDFFTSPPSPEALRERFETVAQAFNLDGDGPRFMQDLTLDSEPKMTWAVADLLITTPGENTLKNNADLFEKRGQVKALGWGATATALLTLQINSPEGGGGSAGGHCVSIRGGGPLTTIAVGTSLWETVWLNVLDAPDFNARFGNAELAGVDAIFPWMARTRSSDKKAGALQTTPQDVHPLQHFWAMPRRIRLNIDPTQLGRCDLSGAEGVPVVTELVTMHSGIKYTTGFRHPLGPYYLDTKNQEWRAVRSRSSVVAYSEWPALVGSSASSEPARAITSALSRHAARQNRVAMLSFGFETKQEKAMAWHSGLTPLIPIDAELESAFREACLGLVEASDLVRGELMKQIKNAIARRPQDLPGDLGPTVNTAFWSSTERAFFEAAAALRDALTAGTSTNSPAERWLGTLHQQALRLFEVYAQSQGDFGAVDARRVAVSWNTLRRFTAPQNGLLRKAVDLPVEERKAPKKKTRPKEETP